MTKSELKSLLGIAYCQQSKIAVSFYYVDKKNPKQVMHDLVLILLPLMQNLFGKMADILEKIKK